MKIVWTRRADCDLDAVADYLGAGTSPPVAVRRILEAVEHLAEHPRLGRPGRIPGTRELIVSDTPYIVPYRVRGQRLEVLRVLHSARRWPDASDLVGL
jgi:toxin ParE1/3/4